ncbi:hypothetical protein [Sphingobacterium sp. MYb382]|uniref:hypothetical protein n=1 Tax=Sphingobacterium sp. MYb382 TaxID=2745278 RepID=UPI0030962233
MVFDTEYKNAIALLPAKEKDKLLLRLLRKDMILAKRLYFELVSEDTVEERREEMEDYLEAQVATCSHSRSTAKQILLALRTMSKSITEHVKVTKDKFGEASLNLLMLNITLRECRAQILNANANLAYRLDMYIVVRTFKILMLINTLHEDFAIEFEDGLNELRNHYDEHPRLRALAINNRIAMSWLAYDQIPEDIAQLNKEARAAGLLR